MVAKKAKKGRNAILAEKVENHLELGAKVKIRNSGGLFGRIVELRGPLGPGGAHIYRIRVRRKPKPIDIEVRGDQLAVFSPKG
jgi:hypothetical protein